VPRAESFVPRVDPFKDLSHYLQQDEKADDWRERARCRGRVSERFDPWFADERTRRGGLSSGPEVALACCAMCPVARPCLEDSLGLAVVHHGSKRDRDRFATPRKAAEWGIFGGLLPRERVGKTADDVDELLVFARKRAIEAGLAPSWVGAA
jgi:hypothetical protein